MKKSLAGLVGAVLLFTPLLVSAQVATSSPADMKAQLIAALYAELQILETEIQTILTQQAQIQATQATQSQQIQQIADTVSPVAGSTENDGIMSDMSDETPPVSQAAITVAVTNVLVTPPSYIPSGWVAANISQYPFGYYYLEAQVLDSDGNIIPPGTAGGLTPISMTVNGKTQNAIIDTGNATTGGYHLFMFSPPAAGTYVLTFASGDLSATTTIVAIANATSTIQ